jgi:hypothetical protein
MIKAIQKYINIPFTKNDMKEREKILSDYKNDVKLKALIKAVF